MDDIGLQTALYPSCQKQEMPPRNQHVKRAQVIPLSFEDDHELPFVLPVRAKPARPGREQGMRRVITLEPVEVANAIAR